jgi:PAS domain S-box-containing protein
MVLIGFLGGSVESFSRTILLVEDEALIALSETSQLKKAGYSVIHSLTGENAIKIVNANPSSIDLILMDIDLGEGIDGTETARQIHTTADIPVLFLSSHTETEIVHKSEKITNYGYVVKSSSFTVLDASIKMAFKLYAASRQSDLNSFVLERTNEELHASLAQQKKIERGLLESESRFRLLFQNANTGNSLYEVVLDDAGIPSDYRYLEVNPAFEKRVGKKASELIGRTILDVFPQTEQFWLDKFSEVVLSNTPNHFLRYNKELNVYSELNIYVPQKGQLAIASLDITKRRQAKLAIQEKHEEYEVIDEELRSTIDELQAQNEELQLAANSLRESESKYRILAENSSDIIFTVDETGTYSFVNAVFASILNKGTDEIIGKTYWDFFPKPDADARQRITKRVFTTGEKESFEISVPLPDKTLYFSSTTNPIKNETGKVILAMVYGKDVTERKLMEESLRESETKYRQLVNNSYDIIYTLSAEGVFLFVSPSWTTLLGYSVDQVVGKQFQAFVHPDDVTQYLEFLQIINKTEQPQKGVEYRIKHINGSWRWHTSSAAPISNAKRQIVGFQGTARDITDRKIDEQTIKALLNEKELLLKEVHHRVKNNLNTISSLLSLQAQMLNEPSAIMALNETAQRVRSIGILYDKLYLSEDYTELSVKAYLPSLIDEIVANFPNSAYVKVRNDIEDFILDIKRMQSLGIITNELLTNIMKYAFVGRTDGLITVSAAKSDGHIAISFQDNGVGMPESVSFEDSTGFGLKLVQALAQQLGGIISIERGTGTKIVLEFTI